MTSLTTSRVIVAQLDRRPVPGERRQGLRGLLARMAAVAGADTARRSLAGVPDHLLRDIGLSKAEIHVLDL